MVTHQCATEIKIPQTYKNLRGAIMATVKANKGHKWESK